jgi:hypothetical protein
MPNTIVITPDRNVHSTDYVGAFDPESRTYMKIVPGQHKLIKFDASKPMSTRKKAVFSELAVLPQSFEAVAVFCHGWSIGLQAGIRKADVPDFVRLICAATKNGVSEKDVLHIMLFCCSTAAGKNTPEHDSETGGDGGFADLLRDTLCAQGRPWVRVYAHPTKGHTTQNTQVRIFEGKGSPVGAVAGQWLVHPTYIKSGNSAAARALWSSWHKALMGKLSGTMREPAAWHAGKRGVPVEIDRKHLRFAAPFMTIAELHGALTGLSQ